MDEDHYLLTLILAYVIDDGNVGGIGKFFISLMKLTSFIGILLALLKQCLQYFA